MLVIQKVKVKWGSINKKHFISLGYNFTKLYDEFEVNADELTTGSNIKVRYICDYCNGKYQKNEWKSYHDLLKRREKSGKDCCENRECLNKKISESHHHMAAIRNSLFDKFPEIANEWHPSLNDKTPHEYSYGSSHIVWWLCPKGHEYNMTIKKRTRKKNGCGCPYCSNNKVYHGNCLANTYPKIAREWHPTKNGKLTPNDVVYGSNKKVWWKCKDDHEWKAGIDSRTKIKTGCPICKESKGEKKVRKYLKQNKLTFKSQFEFKDLVGLGGGLLRFDFAVFDKNANLINLIEYDGEFHYREVYKGDGHKLIKAHDGIKNKYCEDNDIPLLRIPYWEFDNIESIISNFYNSKI